MTPDSAHRVLLIDDDELVADSLRHYLLGEGYSVDVALDRRSAEGLMSQSSYRVIVVDPYLTGELQHEGASLVDLVRAQQPGASVIVLTAYRSPAVLRVSAEREGDVLLTKPQPVVSLAGAIGTLAGAIGR